MWKSKEAGGRVVEERVSHLPAGAASSRSHLRVSAEKHKKHKKAFEVESGSKPRRRSSTSGCKSGTLAHAGIGLGGIHMP